MTDRTEYWARKVLELEVERKSAEMALEEAKAELLASLKADGQNQMIIDGWKLKVKTTPAHFVRVDTDAERIRLDNELMQRGLYGEVHTVFSAPGFHKLTKRLTDENGGEIPGWLNPFVSLREESYSISLPTNYALSALTAGARRASEELRARNDSVARERERSRREAFYAGEGAFFDPNGAD